MTTQVLLNDTLNILECSKSQLSVNKEGIKVKCPIFNVMQSSEISKVLRELTQCVANERDLLLLNSRDIIWSDKCTNSNLSDPVPRNDISCSEVSGSTTTNCSNDHAQVRRESQTYICDDCGKHFSKKDFLQKHRIVHEEPRHRCNVCEKSFVREDKLKRHFVSIHSKQRPHVCSICSKAFARKDKLKDHQKHHVTVSNNFLCFECHIPFVQKSDLNRHARNAHKSDDGGTNVAKIISQSDNRLGNINSSVVMPATLLPLFTSNSQSFHPMAVADDVTSNKVRKSRSNRSTKSARPSAVLSVTGTAHLATLNTSLLTSTIPDQVFCPPLPDLIAHNPSLTNHPSHICHPHVTATSLSLGTVSTRPTPITDSTRHNYSSISSSLIQCGPPSSSTSSSGSSSIHYSSPPTYNYCMEPIISSVFSLATPTHDHINNHNAHLHLQSNNHNHHQQQLKPHTANLLLTHQSLCQLTPHAHPLRYYHPYMPHRSPPILGHCTAVATNATFSPRPLTTNIYPYLPF